jgi:flagellar hook capping protein FlgD
LLALAGARSEVTITGVPEGSGARMGIDRDRDGYWDGDELDAGSDPGDPASTPLTVGVPSGPASGLGWHGIAPNPFRSSTEFHFSLSRAGAVDLVIHDALGRVVRRLATRQSLGAGPHSLRWDGRNDIGVETRTGVYFMRLKTDGGSWTRPVVRMR